MTAKEALGLLKNRTVALSLNHKIGSRDIAKQEVKEIVMSIKTHAIPTLEEALEQAKKEHELLELYRKLSKELHLEIETDWSDDWADIYDFETLECQVDDLAIETFKQIKELEEGE